MEYRCRVCGNDEYKTEKVAMTGTGLTKLKDVQSKEFNVIECTNCGYSEFFKLKSGMAWNVIDLFT